MQEIRRFTWCDVPDDANGHAAEPAESFHVVINDYARVVDLCETHAKLILSPLQVALADYGHRPDRVDVRGVPTSRPGQRSAKAPDQFCLWCTETFTTAGSLASHMTRKHGFPAAQAHGAGIVGIFGKHGCPFCGHKTRSGAAFGMHIFRNHEDMPRTMSGAYIYARDHGDPMGAAAKVMALAPAGRYVAPRRRGSS